MINSIFSAVLLLVFGVGCLPDIHASVDILEAGEGIEFRDMGLDPATGRITLVGTENGVAKVFYVSEDRQSLTSAELVGTGPDTIVAGISSEGRHRRRLLLKEARLVESFGSRNRSASTRTRVLRYSITTPILRADHRDPRLS